MPSNQDRRPRQVQPPWRRVERERPDAAAPTAGAADQADLGEADPAGRQHRSGWFEQSRPDPSPAPAAPAEPEPGILVRAQRQTPRAWLLSALAVTLAVGLALGFAVGSGRAATRAPATQPAQAPRTSVVVVARPTASPACLETARRGDQLIDLLISNQRSRAADLLVAYTVASRQCRKDTSP
jgi:hypothetical protein